MYTISVWASRHVWPSRIAIVLLNGVLTLLGLFIGAALQLFQIAIASFAFYATIVLFLSVFLLYPQKGHRQRFQHFYQYHKTCDFILAGATFFFLIFIGNQPQKLVPLSAQPAVASVVLPATGVVAKSEGATEKMIQPKNVSKKIFRHGFMQKIRMLRKAYKETSPGGKAALIVLSIIVALGLLYLVAALSCGIACSGSGGLAILVVVLGIGLITFFLIRVIRRIQHGPKHPKSVDSL